MSKTGRKWLKTDWSDTDCVRAADIPYDVANSVKDKIDNTYTKSQVDALVGSSGGTTGSGVSKTISTAFLAASVSAVLTVSSRKRCCIKEIELHNTGSASVELRLWLASNDNGSVRTVANDDRYQALKIQVPAGETIYISVNWTLDSANDSIQAKAGTADKISSRIHYVEEAV